MKQLLTILLLSISIACYSQSNWIKYASIEFGKVTPSNEPLTVNIDAGISYKGLTVLTGIRGEYNSLFLWKNEIGYSVGNDFWMQGLVGIGYLANIYPQQDRYVPNPGDTIFYSHGYTTNGIWAATETIRIGYKIVSCSYTHCLFSNWYSIGLTIKID